MKTTTRTVKRVDYRWLNAEIGRRIRAERERHGWTQGELGIYIGVTRVAITNWESGKHQTNFLVSRVYDLALIFGVPVGRLLP